MLSGIAGVIYPDLIQVKRWVDPMIDTLSHRSKRGSTFHSHKNLQLGICGRDLARNEKNSLIVGLDGTIYNGDSLKNELRKKGIQVPLTSCSDLILASYDVWGIDCLKHFSGDFALYIFDQKHNKLILARDRIGKKPLYWYHDNNHFLFASELKALLATGIIPQTVAHDSLSAYLFFGYIPQDMTPIMGINKLLPSFYLEIDLNQRMNIEPYWSYSTFFNAHSTSSQGDVVNKIGTLLEESVRIRMRESGKVGCFALGGIGSASVAHYLCQHRRVDEIEGYSVAFQGQNEEDLNAATLVLETLHIPQMQSLVTPSNFLDNLVKIAWYLDEPIADPNVVATWQLAEMGSSRNETIFSGMGSDETLAGHKRYTKPFLEDHFWKQPKLQFIPHFARKFATLLGWLKLPGAYNMAKLGKLSPWEHYYLEENALFSTSEIEKISPKIADRFNAETFFKKFYHIPHDNNPVASFLYFDVKTRLADCYIQQYERLTAAHHLQWRTPYLDHNLMEFLAGLTFSGDPKMHEPIYYLETLLKDVFPKKLLDRPKVDRPHFLQYWTKTPEINQAFQLLKKGTLVDTELVSREWLSKQLDAPIEQCNFRSLFAILMLEVWFRLYINHSVSTSPPNIGLMELLNET